MTSYMWQKGALPLSLILLLAVICARATAMPITDEEQPPVELTTIENVALEEEPVPVQSTSQPHRIDCKLPFDATMDSLEQQQLLALQLQDNGCNVPYTSSTNKPADASHGHHEELEQQQQQQQQQQQLEKDHKPASVLRHSMSGSSSSQPLYELQLVVWPSDVEDGADLGSTTPRTTTSATTTTTTTTTATPSLFPLYEDQLVVFPQMDFQEENFDYFFDELPADANASSTTQQPFASSTTTPRPITEGPDPTPLPVYVLENYRIKHANGTEEHKLALSNGLVNYMKLYVKRVDDRQINVQEGYNSVPVAGQKPQIQTLYYIADERGYNVYKIEYSPLSTTLPTRVLYKATKSPESKPNI